MPRRAWYLLISLPAGACADAPTIPPTPPPTPGLPGPVAIVSRSPIPEAVGVPRDAVIAIEFGAALDPATLNGAVPPLRVLGRWSGLMAGDFALGDGGRRLEFRPERQFLAGDQITVILSPALRGADGAVLGRSVTYTFWAASAAGTLDLQSAGTVSVRAPGEGRVQSYGAYAGDLNGDGYPDLVVPNEIANDLRVFLNDGAGGYGEFAALPIPETQRPSTNEGTDFDFDGRIDFAVGSAGADVLSVFDGVAGGLAFGANYAAAPGVRGLCVLDLDGDGYLDIVTANRAGGLDGNLTRFINDGAGRFTPLGSVETGTDGETACATGEVDGDGLTDLFVGAIGSGEVVVMHNAGTGELTPGARIGAAGGPWMVASGDVNGDGHVDVVTANFSASTASVLVGDGAGGLRLDDSYPVGNSPLAVDLGDLDGDGDLDLVTSDFGGATWTVLENVGAGRFDNPRTLDASSAGSCGVLNDRDGDGDLDLTGVDEVDDLLFLFTNGA